MSAWVLDASAVIAYFRSEPGAEVVAQALPSSLLSATNAGEVVARLIRLGAQPRAASALMRRLDCEIVPVDAALGLRAGELIVATGSRGLSLGDRTCLTLAEREGLAALTADRLWAELDLDIKVELIR